MRLEIVFISHYVSYFYNLFHEHSLIDESSLVCVKMLEFFLWFAVFGFVVQLLS